MSQGGRGSVMLFLKHKGFTLIELLIVVAIIAILAAIAVPNFLEAQTRAKATRMKGDLRTMAIAVESYFSDNNAYPPHRTTSGEVPYPDRFTFLTTPIAYLPAIPTRDVFYRDDINGPGGSKEWISWTNFSSYPRTHALYAVRITHRYMLRSRGPDGINETNDVRNAYMTKGLEEGPSMIYDGSNGTISPGDIVRTARFWN